MDLKLLARTAAAGAVPALLFAVAAPHNPGAVFSDACCAAGLTLGAFGMWRLSRRMHFLDGAIYGFARLRHSNEKRDGVHESGAFPDRAEYERKHPYVRPCAEPLLAAGAWLLASVISALLL